MSRTQRVFAALADGEKTADELMQMLGLSRVDVGNALTRLRQRGHIESTPVCYAVTEAGIIRSQLPSKSPRPPKPPAKFTRVEQQERALEGKKRLLAGERASQIAKSMGVSVSSVHGWRHYTPRYQAHTGRSINSVFQLGGMA